ncbi:hypothetical protein, partial [Helicobacter bizzozeronii]|uniref:hypothetical protein n=1 Tax=Helicobacter bizzozeronii TaxID=56877 RepID=UPI0025551B1F
AWSRVLDPLVASTVVVAFAASDSPLEHPLMINSRPRSADAVAVPLSFDMRSRMTDVTSPVNRFD